MITLLSPAKSLNFDVEVPDYNYSEPLFKNELKPLVQELKKLSPDDIKQLMKLSDNLAQLNYQRYQEFSFNFKLPEAKPAALAFTGEVYKGLNANDFSPEEMDFAQQHIRILSGLYGMLKPFDLILPYRLEMGTKFSFSKYKNLYDFWKEKVTETLQNELKKQATSTIINLASTEYFKVVDTKKLNTQIITPVFKDNKNGQYKVIMMYAKKARGLMSRFIVKNKINTPEHLQAFDLDGYAFNPSISTETEWVFTRG